ncbi:mRNA export factor Gle1 [Phymastichus coffea]|uniref:mRNA export factor Gle1 n=1 Tax=Phymastichus coffea TaxID=108790 RepID=UPI00273A8959|nr:mRNA export factor Gle1 [Phymastichus coffea]
MPHPSINKNESTDSESNMSSTLSSRNNIKFSVKKILYENENQRREKVKRIVELKRQEMEKKQKDLQSQLSKIFYQKAIQREKEIAERLASLEMKEEQLERQLEIDRKNEVQRQRIKESDEISKQILPFQEILYAKWTDIINTLKSCQDKNSAAMLLNQYSSRLKELNLQMETINEKVKNGTLTLADVKMAEIIAGYSNEICLLFKGDIDEIDALCEQEIERNEKNLLEANLSAESDTQKIEPVQDLEQQNINTVHPDANNGNIDHVFVQQSPETVSESLPDNSIAVSENIVASIPAEVPSEQKVDETLKQAEDVSLQIYLQSCQFLRDYNLLYQDFAQSIATKKFKFECQKSLNLAVNAISHASREQLVDKFERLKAFLLGKGTPNISSNPQAQYYSKCLLAQKIVEQGDTSISSKPELAFPFAAIAVALWNDWPDFGDLLLAFFRTKCPFFIPLLLHPEPNQSEEIYIKLIGWKCTEDGELEKPEQYWKRIGGMMYLYASIIVTKQRQSVNKPHPHGLAHAWRWLAATLNIEPTCDTADIFATLIFTMLEVAGNDLWKTYPNQFPKVLLVLKNVYFQKLNNFDSVVKAPVIRLGELIESALKNSHIPPPKGQLPPGFW